MKAKLTGSVLVATLIFSGATVFTDEAQSSPRGVALKENRTTTTTTTTTTTAAQPQSTSFRCIQNGNGFATIAQRGDRTTPPIITWNATLGRHYNPQARCNVVSQRLTQAVARNGGKLKNLQLKAGPVKNQVVICVLSKTQSVCNSSNMLFTLRSENARRSDQIVARLNNFSIKGSGAPVAESYGLNSVSLEDLNRFLGSEDRIE